MTEPTPAAMLDHLIDDAITREIERDGHITNLPAYTTRIRQSYEDGERLRPGYTRKCWLALQRRHATRPTLGIPPDDSDYTPAEKEEAADWQRLRSILETLTNQPNHPLRVAVREVCTMTTRTEEEALTILDYLEATAHHNHLLAA